MYAINLKTEYLKNPMGIDIRNPRLMWNCKDGIRQSAYQIICREDDGKLLWDSGKVTGTAMQAVYSGERLKSRTRVLWKVRLWDENNQDGEWSQETFFELGLMARTNWMARWITGNYKVDKNQRYPVDCFLTYHSKNSPSSSGGGMNCNCNRDLVGVILSKKEQTFLQYTPFSAIIYSVEMKGMTEYMKNIDHNSHSVYLLYYHLILVVKYRREVFTDPVSNRAKDIFLYIAPNYGIILEEWNHDGDHVHIMFRAQPKTELSRFINAYKSASSRLLKKEYPQIRQKLWKETFWSQSFCLLSAGGAPIEVIRQYIETQGEKDGKKK